MYFVHSLCLSPLTYGWGVWYTNYFLQILNKMKVNIPYICCVFTFASEYVNELRPGVPAAYIPYCLFSIPIWSRFQTRVRSVPAPLRFLVRGLVAIQVFHSLSSIDPFRFPYHGILPINSRNVHAKIKYHCVSVAHVSSVQILPVFPSKSFKCFCSRV